MNTDNLRNIGTFHTVDNLPAGTIGLMGDHSWSEQSVRDVLVIACQSPEEELPDFKNSEGALCLAVFKDEDGKISYSLLSMENSGEDWVYIPANKPKLMIDPSTRRKTRYCESNMTLDSIYLSESGEANLKTKFGTLDLKKLSFSSTGFDRAYLMSVKDWGFFETVNDTLKPFWP